MKKSLKKITLKFLKWTGITLLVLIILLVLIPIFFKDQIKQMIIDEVNKELKAELSIRDFDLTFISTFPNMTVQLYDTKLTGKDEFKGVELVNIKTVTAHVSFWDVIFSDQIEVDEIHIEKPIIDVRILKNGLANYDIVKTEEEKTPEENAEPSNFKLSLSEYSVKNARIKYDDRASDMYAELINVNHSGSGDLTADELDFVTETSMDKLSFEMEGLSYLTDVKTDADVKIFMKFTDKSSKFTLKENAIAMNNLNFSVSGYYEMFDGYDDMDLKMDASKASFKDFLSLIPTFYHSGYEHMVSSGKMTLNGMVKGKMDDKNLPGWDFGMKLKNGSIKYPGLSKITNVQVDAGSKFPGGEDLDEMTIDVPKFHANLSQNTIDASLIMKRLMTDPYIQSSVDAHVDLASIEKFIPMEEGEKYTGILDADVDIKGAMSDLDAGDYEAFTASGVLELSKMNYSTSTLTEDVKVDHMKMTFSPETLTLNEMDAVLGKSDFKMSGEVHQYFGYMLRDEVLEGDFDFNSNYLDLDELMGVYPEESDEGKSGEDGGRHAATVETEPTLVPNNINFNLRTNIGKAHYNGIDVKDISGDVHLKDQVAELENCTMKAMGGTVGLTGSYNTKDPAKPLFDFGYNLKDIDIEELTSNFLTVGKLAPIAKYAKGRITSNFSMSSELDNALMPLMNSISSDGDLSSNKLAITGFETLEKIEKVTRFKDFSKQTFKNFKTHFSIHDGKVLLTPFDLKMGGINTKVSGYTTLEKEMHYKMAMKVPREKIPAALLKEVEKGLSFANGLHPDIKVGELPAFLPVNVFATGDPKNPKITTDLKEVVAAAVKDKVGGIVDDVVSTVKDSVTTIIKDEVEDIKGEIEAQKKKILAEAKKKADKIRAEAKSANKKAKEEADKHAEAIIKEAGSNPIKKKLAEAAAKKYKDEAYKKADDALATANKKADDVEKKALEEANKLG